MTNDNVNEAGEIFLRRSQQLTQKKYAELNKFAENAKSVLIGDSIAEGFPVWEMLKGRSIYNRGVSGDTTEQMLSRLEDTVFALAPENVYIWIGTNDIGRLVPSKQTLSNVKRTFEQLREKLPEVKLFLLSVCPVNRDYDPIDMVWGRTNEQVKNLNNEYKKICKECKVEFLDFYDNLTDRNGDLNLNYTVDGLHLSVAGYKAVIESIKSEI